MFRKFINRLTGTPYFRSRKKVLILEGGGMRGIFLTGVLQAFTDRRFFPWKLIIGSSAGALTGAAYAAGQIHIARDAFFSELLSGKFITLTNILRQNRHVLNLDWMIETIVQGSEPLDRKALGKSCPVLITATDCRPDNVPRTLYLDSRKDDPIIALKATAAIPFLYRGFVEYKNHRFLDGGLLDPIPYLKALEMGFRESEILVVLTRVRGYRKKEESVWIRALYESYYRNREFRFLIEAIENRFIHYNKLLDDLENRFTGIDVLYPPEGFRVDRLTRDPKKILEGFGQGISTGREYYHSLMR
ncbi:MAG: patatin family protein [Spirochaetes bacterium]|nr:MAG: patatin family protein [Spirochaetota bacterium]